MSSQRKKSIGANSLIQASEVLSRQNSYANRHNLNAEELLSEINSYSNSITTLLDTSTAFTFDKNEKQKMLFALNKMSAKLDEYKRLFANLHTKGLKGGKKTLRKRKSGKKTSKK